MRFGDATLGEKVLEIAYGKLGQVTYLHEQLYPRSSDGTGVDVSVALPAIDIGGGVGPFGRMASRAGVGGAGGFDPYADDRSFLLAAVFLADAGVALGKSIVGRLKNVGYAHTVSSVLGGDGYHAGMIRDAIVMTSDLDPSILRDVDRISDYRDSLDGGDDDDVGLLDGASRLRVVATGPDGLPFARDGQRTLNALFLTAGRAVAGGFFPSGINGNLRESGG